MDSFSALTAMSDVPQPYVFSLLEQFPVTAAGKTVAVRFPFVRAGRVLPDVLCGISLLDAGSMRFRWNEENPRRRELFASCGIEPDCVRPLELIHSRIVYTDKTYKTGVTGDGLLSADAHAVLSVTVADCMPVYLYDPETGVRGMLHSGWKGTGIVRSALQRAAEEYGVRAENVCAVIGPHIRNCCYSVDSERAAYFKREFTPECISVSSGASLQYPFMLSLEKANLALLHSCGVPAENIAVCADCTSCSPFLGSHRRETASLPQGLTIEERSRFFTVMAAFVQSTVL